MKHYLETILNMSFPDNHSKTRSPYPDWLKRTAIYQIFPPSFQDSNGDGIGDLQGILSRLDYIRDLGFETVWLSPIFESPFRDAGYDVSDYYKIAPRYGTMDDFEALVQALHDRGMKLLLDFVPGHTSDEHPWFAESCKHAANRYSERYVWTDTTFYIGDSRTGPGQFIVGHGDRDGNYLANFFYFQPALNYGYADPHPERPWQLPTDHPSVKALREEMQRVMRYWLDKGVDGFRVDMAGHLIKGNDPARIQAKMVEFWKEVREWWDRDYPEAALISEWSDPSCAIETGFHVDFMIHFNGAAYMKLFRGENEHTIIDRDETSYFRPDGGGELQSFFREFQGHLAYIGNRGLISLPTGNHDLPRYSIGRSQQELKNILTFLFTLPAVPTLYYGDEIGLRSQPDLPSKEGAYRRTGARTPMQWDSSEGGGFSKAASDQHYLPIDTAPDRPTTAAQLADANSLLNHVKTLLQLRKQHPALGPDGILKQLNPVDAPYPTVYLRAHKSERILVAINALAEPQETLLEPLGTVEEALLGDARIQTDKDGSTRIQLKPFSFVMAKLAPPSIS